jgi:tetratricopeptide (TPR) repeat protein
LDIPAMGDISLRVRRVVYLLLFSIAAVAAGLVIPQDSGAESLNLRSAYECLRDAAYNDEPLDAVTRHYEIALQELEQAFVGSRERSLWASRLEYMMGRAFQAWDRKEEAAAHYERGLAHTEAAMAGGAFSEGWRMTSEHVSQLCLVKDLGYLLANGRKVTEYAEKAVALDPANVGARIILAAGKIYAPVVVGGNPRVGLAMMREILDLAPGEKDDLFNIYSGIGLACAKLGRRREARQWYEKALGLYPNNRYLYKEFCKLED